MSDPTDYHRKLAVLIFKELHDEHDMCRHVEDAVCIVLASERVVDPEVIRRDMKSARENTAMLTQEVERLTADRDALRRFIAKHDWQHTPDAAEYEALTSGIEERGDE